jgi:hypothetical protein
MSYHLSILRAESAVLTGKNLARIMKAFVPHPGVLYFSVETAFIAR